MLGFMDLRGMRELEEEIGRLWVELPRERRESRHDIRHVNKKYVLDPGGEIQVWYCRDRDNEMFIVLLFRWTPYYYEWGEGEEAWRIA